MKPATPQSVREAILRAVAGGERQGKVAAAFGVSISTVERLMRKKREGQTITAGRAGRPLVVPKKYEGAFKRLIDLLGDMANIQVLAQLWKRATETEISSSTVRRMFARLRLVKQRSDRSILQVTAPMTQSVVANSIGFLPSGAEPVARGPGRPAEWLQRIGPVRLRFGMW